MRRIRPHSELAKKVFPALPEQEAMDKLWDAIFTSVRISGKGDSVARWREHVALLKSRIAKLNDLHFTSLYYQNSLGTSLNIKLPETHVWARRRQHQPRRLSVRRQYADGGGLHRPAQRRH